MDALVRRGGNWTLAHEHTHAIFSFARKLGVFGDETDPNYDPAKNELVQLFRGLFGDPHGSGELFNEEAAADGLANFLRGRYDFLAGLKPEAKGLLERTLDAVGDFVKGLLGIASTPRDVNLRREAEADAFEAIRKGDFRGLSKYAGIDFTAEKPGADGNGGGQARAGAKGWRGKVRVNRAGDADSPQGASERAADTIQPSPTAGQAETPPGQTGANEADATEVIAELRRQLAEARSGNQNAVRAAGNNAPHIIKSPSSNLSIKAVWEWIPRAQIVSAKAGAAIQQRDREGNSESFEMCYRRTRKGIFDPLYMTGNYTGDSGAAIVGGGNVCLSGNGRQIMLDILSEEGRFDEYLEPIRQWARENGIGDCPAELLDKEPELVQRVVEAEDEAKLDQFARECNENNKQELNDIEKAKGDAAVASATLVRHSVIGVLGATALDRAEEATTRMDNLAVARKMEGAGKDAKTVRLATGWERGADGKWRYEVEDIQPKADYAERFSKEYFADGSSVRAIKLGDLVESGELFTAYPDLPELDIVIHEIAAPGAMAFFFPGTKTSLGAVAPNIVLAPELFLTENPEFTRRVEELKSSDAFKAFERAGQSADHAEKASALEAVKLTPEWRELQNLLNGASGIERYVEGGTRWVRILEHEIQHYIQEREGFAQGGADSTYDKYMNALHKKAEVWMLSEDFAQKHAELGEPKSHEGVWKAVIDEWLKNGRTYGDKYGTPEMVQFVDAFRLWEYGTGREEYRQAFNKWVYLTERHGLSGSEINNPINTKKISTYSRLAGETEARNVEARMGMTAEERRRTLLSETEDVAREDQIVLDFALTDGLKGANSARLYSVAVPAEGISRSEAKTALDALRGKFYINRATGIEARLSSTGAGKLISNAAAGKTQANGFSKEQHNALAARINELFENAFPVSSRPDRDGDPNIASIKRFVCHVGIGETEAAAYITVKESTEHGHRIYSMEGMKIEELSPMVRRAIADRNAADNSPNADIIAQSASPAPPQKHSRVCQLTIQILLFKSHKIASF